MCFDWLDRSTLVGVSTWLAFCVEESFIRRNEVALESFGNDGYSNLPLKYASWLSAHFLAKKLGFKIY